MYAASKSTIALKVNQQNLRWADIISTVAFKIDKENLK